MGTCVKCPDGDIYEEGMSECRGESEYLNPDCDFCESSGCQRCSLRS